MTLIKTMVRNFQENIGYTPKHSFTRIKIHNLTPAGPRAVKVRHVETHRIDERNMIDISGKFPVIHNYTPNVRTLEGKQEEIHDPIQLKFLAMWCAKDWTIQTIQDKLGKSYRQARKIKLYQKAITSPMTNEEALYFLDLHFL